MESQVCTVYIFSGLKFIREVPTKLDSSGECFSLVLDGGKIIQLRKLEIEVETYSSVVSNNCKFEKK